MSSTESQVPAAPATARQNSSYTRELGLDDILPFIGEYGRYQKLLIWAVIFPICALSGLQGFKQVIYAETPAHWCRSPPALTPLNLSSALLKMLTVPLDAGEPVERSRCCQMYDLDYDVIYSMLWNATVELSGDAADDLNTVVAYLEQDGIAPKTEWTMVACKYGWDYDQTDFYSTVVTQWDLVCDRSILPAVAQFLNFIGGMVGVMFFGYVADRWGRKLSFFACLAVSVATEALTAVAPNYVVWVIFRLLAGLTTPAMYQVPFILGIELVEAQKRTFVTVVAYVFYSIGLTLFCMLAYFIRHWYYLALATSLPFCLFFIYWKFLPESPRWLLSKGKIDELLVLLKKMSEVNGVCLPEELMARIKAQSLIDDDDEEKLKIKYHRSPLDLFRTPNLRKKTLLLTFCWLTNQSVYGGLNLYGPSMGSNPYVSFGLSALVELPAHVVMVWVMEYWTRRWSLCILMIIGGLSCCGIIFLPAADQPVYGLVLYLVGKFTISATYLVIYAFASEIFPTEVRGMGLGFAAYSGMVASSAIPFVNFLGYNTFSMPLVVMGSMAVLGGLVVLGLPETLHTPFPQTLDEGEEFGKNVTTSEFFSCLRFREKVEESEHL